MPTIKHIARDIAQHGWRITKSDFDRMWNALSSTSLEYSSFTAQNLRAASPRARRSGKDKIPLSGLMFFFVKIEQQLAQGRSLVEAKKELLRKGRELGFSGEAQIVSLALPLELAPLLENRRKAREQEASFAMMYTNHFPKGTLISKPRAEEEQQNSHGYIVHVYHEHSLPTDVRGEVHINGKRIDKTEGLTFSQYLILLQVLKNRTSRAGRSKKAVISACWGETPQLGSARANSNATVYNEPGKYKKMFSLLNNFLEAKLGIIMKTEDKVFDFTKWPESYCVIEELPKADPEL
jgi:hypothetical protein